MTRVTPPEFRDVLKQPLWQFASLFVLVFCSRLPFLDAGYGVNVDAWRVARVARDIAISGQYLVSRFPGYPVQEIVCSWFWKGGPVALNLLTTVWSAIAATVFAGIARKLRCRDWWLSGLALAALPVFFVNSVCTKDYVWALALFLLSVFAALHDRPISAGLLLGVATGCRITSLAMLLPVGLILFGQRPCRRSLIRFALATLVTAVMVISPVWLRYGTGFFTFYENHTRPDWPTIISRGTVEIWGSAGLIGLSIALAALIFRRGKMLTANRQVVAGLWLAIVIYLAAYLRLPDQAGYLLPIVPCVLLLVNLSAPAGVWRTICLLLAFSSLIETSPRGLTPGAIFTDHAERLATLARIRDFLLFADKLPGRNTFVVGAWEPQIAVLAPNLVNGKDHYVYALTANEATICLQKNERIVYIPPMREFNLRVTGADLAQFGALDLQEALARGQVGLTRAVP